MAGAARARGSLAAAFGWLIAAVWRACLRRPLWLAGQGRGRQVRTGSVSGWCLGHPAQCGSLATASNGRGGVFGSLFLCRWPDFGAPTHAFRLRCTPRLVSDRKYRRSVCCCSKNPVDQREGRPRGCSACGAQSSCDPPPTADPSRLFLSSSSPRAARCRAAAQRPAARDLRGRHRAARRIHDADEAAGRRPTVAVLRAMPLCGRIPILRCATAVSAR